MLFYYIHVPLITRSNACHLISHNFSNKHSNLNDNDVQSSINSGTGGSTIIRSTGTKRDFDIPLLYRALLTTLVVAAMMNAFDIHIQPCRAGKVDQNTVVIPPLLHSSSCGCRTRRLREYSGKRVAASSVLLLPCTAITNTSAQRGDYGQTSI
ncbi:jg26446 [Pararge aegeria aegeria]|uniref:Jg26446 protein n=1 Tax=Pararge aegeria aegeria TaxID=348720 RepID=A0A8S4QYH4_9NEOP|nr:jg26446 [Pararge aegeria aegeria]